jgi:hypothetical protein
VTINVGSPTFLFFALGGLNLQYDFEAQLGFVALTAAPATTTGTLSQGHVKLTDLLPDFSGKGVPFLSLQNLS